MSENAQTNAYLRTRVLSARPEQLRLLLLDGALKFCRQADRALGSGDHERSYEGFTQAREIVIELVKTIDTRHDPQLADRVRGLYMFMYKELAQAGIKRDRAALGEVIKLLEYERETWVLLIEQLAAERAGGAEKAQAPAATGTDGGPAPVIKPRAPSPYGSSGGGHAPISFPA